MRGGRLWNENLRKEEFATCGSKQQQQLGITREMKKKPFCLG
jgi:hypothetical protein